MAKAYRSGDPYLAFAKQAGAVPVDGTKKTHKSERKLYKECVLAVQYGMGADSLGVRIGRSALEAQDILRMHRRLFQCFWDWSDRVVETALLRGWIETVFGWRHHLGRHPNERSIRNFPMQANGAEMMRLAACLGVERGVEISAPVHDAFLIHAPLNRLDEQITIMQDAMTEASSVVLGGFELTSGTERFLYPDRYCDDRGAEMWNRVNRLLAA